MKNTRFSFSKKFVVPTVMTAFLFVMAFFFFFIPRFERVVLEKKRETIKELTVTATNILRHYHDAQKAGQLTKAQAQEQAKTIIKNLRYGPKTKDYFWIIDTTPRMIVHPYRSDLEGQNVKDFNEYSNKKLFNSLVKAATSKKSDGYVSYYWQWKDNPRKVNKKVSYVRLFKGWNWIIGTGIYVKDVESEIKSLTSYIIFISLIIMVIMSSLLLYIIKQSKTSEEMRDRAETALRNSREKYRSIVEAGTEGVSLIEDNLFIYVNDQTCYLLEYSQEELLKKNFYGIFFHKEYTQKQIQKLLIDNPDGFEYKAEILTKQQQIFRTVLHFSKISQTDKDTFVVTFKNDTKTSSKLDHHNSSDLMVTVRSLGKKLSNLTNPPIILDMNTSVESAALIMKEQKRESILVEAMNKIVGIVTSSNLREYACSPKKNSQIYKIMNSPLITIPENATLFEAITLTREKDINYIATTTHSGEIVGLTGPLELLKEIEHTLGTTLARINNATNIYQLQSIFSEVYQLIHTLTNSGIDGQQILKSYNEIWDNVLDKILSLAHERFDLAPSAYAFIVFNESARSEGTFITNHSCGIILPDRLSEETYYQKFCDYISEALDIISFTPNLQTHFSRKATLSEWKEHLKQWNQDASTKASLIDARVIRGNQILFNEFIQFHKQSICSKDEFLKDLCNTISSPQIPDITSNSIELSSLIAVISAYAKYHSTVSDIDAVNTFDRLNLLSEKKIIDVTKYITIRDSLDVLYQLYFKHQCQMILHNVSPASGIDPSTLPAFEKLNLEKALTEIKILQEETSQKA